MSTGYIQQRICRADIDLKRWVTEYLPRFKAGKVSPGEVVGPVGKFEVDAHVFGSFEQPELYQLINLILQCVKLRVGSLEMECCLPLQHFFLGALGIGVELVEVLNVGG